MATQYELRNERRKYATVNDIKEELKKRKFNERNNKLISEAFKTGNFTTI